MPVTRKQARKDAAGPPAMLPKKKKHSNPNHITALPQPLLEKILISDTSREDKRELRKTCKLFQKTLDNSLTCLRIKAVQECCTPCLKRLLKRSDHVPTLKAVTVSGRKSMKDVLFGSIPKGITDLRIRGDDNNLELLKGLSCLKSLYLDINAGNTTGIEHISGLTYLQCHTPVDSVAHLAPTLKRLQVSDIGYVLDLDKLTNLETLEVVRNMPSNFFETHSRLPLKQLALGSDWNKDFITNASAWISAPTALTRLRLGNADHLQPGVIPATITHLQLVYAEQDCIGKVAAALPWLVNLDLFIDVGKFDWKKAFDPLSKFYKLQCLGLWIFWEDEDVIRHTWPHQQVVSVLSTVPAAEAAIQRGLKLNIVQTGGGLLGAEYDYIPAKATWAVHG